jgi:tRNA threonylcarbamoyladenosine biosynthesis protein TsaE
LGEQIGALLKGGEVIELVSDLGGGKTTFTRGLVRGAGSHDAVASPTFTISREYKAADFIIVHFDFYRLAEAGVVAEELREFVGDSQTVTVVEWGDIVANVLPEDRVSIELSQVGEDARDITIRYPETKAYLFEGLTT